MGTFDVPSAVFDIHESAVNSSINGITGKECTLFFPPKKIECPNCYPDPISKRSTNRYRSGGPISFIDGSICPYCGGAGYADEENSTTVRMRVYFTPKMWRELGVSVENADGIVVTIGFVADAEKIRKCESMTIPNAEGSYRRSGETKPWGFRHKYIIGIWTRN